MTPYRVDVSIGPVQGFLAHSRRTVDLWGSSFLLSRLAAHGIAAARRTGGRVVLPAIQEDRLIDWVEGRKESPPRIGSLPNHFAFSVEGDPEHAAAEVVRSIQAAWAELCDRVWDRFLSPVADLGRGTRRIWDRQVSSFWEIFWTVSPSTEESRLWRRKSWRHRVRPPEPGDKCTVMRDLQELSGFVRSAGEEERERQDSFWESVRRRCGPLNLPVRERLSAIALIKRLYARLEHSDTASWPSTTHVAATRWLWEVETTVPESARAYAELFDKTAFTGARLRHEGRVVREPASGNFARLDSSLFHSSRPEEEVLRAKDPQAARARLDEIHEAVGAPPVFFALLMADGDRLGHLIQEGDEDRILVALRRFPERAKEILLKYDALPIYLGGDDLLAMAPVATALACAQDLSKTWADVFPPGASLSASVTIAPAAYPLGTILGEGRRLLDEVAKEQNGRNSLAVGLIKRHGLSCEWVTTWTRPGPDGRPVAAVELLEAVRQELGQASDEPGISSSFVYRLRDSLFTLTESRRWSPGMSVRLPAGLDLVTLLAAELARLPGLDDSSDTAAETARRMARRMACLLTPAPAGAPRGTAPIEDGEAVLVDGLLLAQALATRLDDAEWC